MGEIRFELDQGVALLTLDRPDAIEGVRVHLERPPPRSTLRVSRDGPEWPGEGGA